jgi:hypothetical protein
MIEENQNIYSVGLRERERKEKLIEYLGEMLIPATAGFPHVNLDMAFTNLGMWDLPVVENLCQLIVYCHINKLKMSEYMARGQLATFLNSRRSKGGKSMDMFTTITTKTTQVQTYEDTSKPKKGFSFFASKKPVAET